MAGAARSRVGAGLSTATLVALGIALFFRIVPTTHLLRTVPGAGALLVLRTEAGWSAFAGGALAWLATYIVVAGMFNAREAWSVARITTEPMASLGLVLWAALLLYYLAFPPRAGGVHGPAMSPPVPGGPPHGPPAGVAHPAPTGQGWAPR